MFNICLTIKILNTESDFKIQMSETKTKKAS